jgi:hypothetical protein
LARETRLNKPPDPADLTGPGFEKLLEELAPPKTSQGVSQVLSAVTSLFDNLDDVLPPSNIQNSKAKKIPSNTFEIKAKDLKQDGSVEKIAEELRTSLEYYKGKRRVSLNLYGEETANYMVESLKTLSKQFRRDLEIKADPAAEKVLVSSGLFRIRK